MLVFDRSGSMSLPSHTAGMTKIQHARRAVALFVDLIRKDRAHNVGLVTFSTVASSPVGFGGLQPGERPDRADADRPAAGTQRRACRRDQPRRGDEHRRGSQPGAGAVPFSDPGCKHANDPPAHGRLAEHPADDRRRRGVAWRRAAVGARLRHRGQHRQRAAHAPCARSRRSLLARRGWAVAAQVLRARIREHLRERDLDGSGVRAAGGRDRGGADRASGLRRVPSHGRARLGAAREPSAA